MTAPLTQPHQRQPLTFANNSGGKDCKPPTKIERVLTALLLRGSLNRVEAEKEPIFDHCLNSTMSCEIGKRLGLAFTSIRESCIGYAGTPTEYSRYSLTAESIKPAMTEVARLRLKRGAEPMSWPAELTD